MSVKKSESLKRPSCLSFAVKRTMLNEYTGSVEVIILYSVEEWSAPFVIHRIHGRSTVQEQLKDVARSAQTDRQMETAEAIFKEFKRCGT